MKFFVSIILSLSLSSSAWSAPDSLGEKIDSYGEIVGSIIKGSLDSNGLSLRAFLNPNLPGWDKVASDINDELAEGLCFEFFLCGYYEDDLAYVTRSRQAWAKRVEPLDNKASFARREELFRNARRSIYIMVWAIYDDESGELFKNQMLSALKRNPQLDIRIIVDGNIATIKNHKMTLKVLEAESRGKIKVMRWKTGKYRANGTHRKMIIVDHEHVITGGMNIGDHYYHLSKDDHWRDQDLYLQGPSVGVAAANQFADLWNSFVTEKTQKGFEKMKLLPEARDAGIPVVLMDQHPGSGTWKAQHSIHTGVVKLMRDAQKSIDIENAYLILDPVLKNEIRYALARGVRVRIFTNSKDSVDEPIVSAPLLKSAKDAADLGAEVYLKKGSTLHSKFMVVDEHISMVGSFNFHPRSLRFDGEAAVAVVDEKLARALTEQFEQGIGQASQLRRRDELKLDWNLLSLLTETFYFDFL